MGLLTTLLGLTGFCLAMWDFSQRLPPAQVPKLRRWFLNWMLKGLATPFLLWLLFNSAVCDWFPPLMPAVEWAKLHGEWCDIMLSVATLGLFVIGTYWAALTAAWLLVVFWRQTDDPPQFRGCVLLWSVMLGPFAVILTCYFGWRLAGLGAALWFLAVLQQVLALQREPARPPLYSRAIAAIHFDKFEEAEQAVIQELETCQDDFDGWMLLAEIYARHFDDLPAAQKLIHEICEHPGTTPSQFAVACHRLADWHLKLAQDPDAARAALAEICRRLPRSHLDHMARLRIRQLPASREECVARHGVKMIQLHPKTPPSGAAQQRLNLLDLEAKLRRAADARLHQPANPKNAASD